MSDNALIEWTGIGATHIATPEGNAFCIPKAITPIPVAIWTIAREWNKHLIIASESEATKEQLDHGRFIEHHAEVTTETVDAKKGPGGKIIEEASTTTVIEAKDLADLAETEARKVIGKIVDPQILQGYLDNPALDALPGLKGAIERRLKVIEEKGKKK